MTPIIAYLLSTNLLNGEPDMSLNELLAAFESEVTEVQAATTAKAAAQEAMTAAQEAVAAANASLTTEKQQARAALDAVIAKLNEIADGLGI
jgi:flagellar hook-associated protein FlgK